MNNTNLLTWKAFKAQLEQHPHLPLQFQYAAGAWVDASYHITEIKQAPIVSVDCGGQMNSWTEVIVQLWEPSQRDSDQAMPVSKALSIIAVVEKVLPLNPLGIVKIEFGNSQFDTRQMYPAAFTVQDGNLVVDLTPDATQCKAIERGGSCGTTASGEECCAPAPTAEKPKVQLVELTTLPGNSCTPGSGCC
ncbi:DUF6428 family protein [Rufibacter glacialis]|uniref:DUF6428 family protein n=1 Tax=Rufibacter glacialis TaxID=1259555 RepID=A0A5M8Q4I4_9BACT|nr:DUF6428 family protein [Rufibacter glacialis]KAA6430283.1 hypothetical protein FOE74_20950 [Rufibacter glacialis]GGK87960.1 hypothetical protein GCM10011405_39650 [Rufibacter glacialis]